MIYGMDQHYTRCYAFVNTNAFTITVSLITKNEIKKISFYAPEFYEKECPGRKGRIEIIKIQAYFLSHFKPAELLLMAEEGKQKR